MISSIIYTDAAWYASKSNEIIFTIPFKTGFIVQLFAYCMINELGIDILLDNPIYTPATFNESGNRGQS